MKTATSPQKSSGSDRVSDRSTLKSLTTLTVAAAATFGLGVSIPLFATAQETGTRTIATGTGIPLSADAPDRYTVKTGDTLWDIAQVFLRDPWYWPEIWYVNPQVKNPHLIYPGDTLALVSIEGRPQVSVAERGPEGAAAEAVVDTGAATGPTRSGTGTRLSPTVRSQPITTAVTAIQYSDIAAFIGRPTILTKDQVKGGAYIVGLRDEHMVGGGNTDVYARGMSDATQGARYTLVRALEALRDPETNNVLGYRGAFVGTGSVVTPGDITKIHADMTQREILQGDKLFLEDTQIPLDFIPHPVAEDFHGTIMAVDGLTVVGKNNVVALNRGKQHGIEPGHVLAISQRGETVKDKFSQGGEGSFWSGGGKKVKLPNERVGLVMVYKVHEQMSFALIMDTTHPVRVGDLVGAP